ncbi:D-alanyl-D-alanine carboxypeptidase/D-alanyl-D-alanine-endopeptidase [Bacteroidota bacterium]
MKDYFISILYFFLVITEPVFSQYFSVQKIVNDNVHSKLLKNAQWSLYAKYVDNNTVIISHNAEMSVAPASGLKLFTTAASLEYLGENYRVETKLLYNGEIDKNGVLEGNIFIVGGGDPTLGSDLVKSSMSLDELMEYWIANIRDIGIRKIEGSIISDENVFDQKPIPDTWEWIDLGNYYAASTRGLNINDNLYYLYFRPNKVVGGKADIIRMEPDIPGLHFTNYMKTGAKGSGDNGYIYNSPYQYNAILRGSIPAGVNEFAIKGSIPDPPLFAVQYLRNSLIEQGIPVSDEAIKGDSKELTNSFKLITNIFSPELREIIYIINKRSFNLYAEQVLKLIGLQIAGKASVESGIELIKKFLENNGVKTNGLLLYDGSGLSRNNAITTKMMVGLLSELTSKKYYDTFYNSLAVAGDTNDIGFFKKLGMGTPIEKNARIKSGLILGVRSYSGYVKDRNNRLIAFSLIANNFNGSGSRVSKIHQQIIIELSKLK